MMPSPGIELTTFGLKVQHAVKAPLRRHSIYKYFNSQMNAEQTRITQLQKNIKYTHTKKKRKCLIIIYNIIIYYIYIYIYIYIHADTWRSGLDDVTELMYREV